MTNPDRSISWTGISVAHPTAFGEALANDPDQQSRSGYFALFQTPWLPEALFSWGDFTLLTAGFGNMTESQQNEYLAVLSEPGALTATLNWYRNITSGLSAANPPPPETNCRFDDKRAREAPSRIGRKDGIIVLRVGGAVVSRS